MLRGRPLAYLIAALVYVILPWDFDFIPLVGRIDDLLVVSFALWYAWKMRPAPRRRGPEKGPAAARQEGEPEDPYQLLGIAKSAPDDEVKRAYRELLGKYHPDRVQHLGEDLRELAARRAVAINRAYETIKRERGLI